MDKDLDEITNKLADDADELDLNDADFEADDEVINLLNDEPSALPSDAGLDYEEPDDEAASGFAATLEAQQATTSMKTDKRSPQIDTVETDSFLDDDDPMLLLDEELEMDKDSNDGGILTLAALILAVVGISVAAFAAYQGMSASEQLGSLSSYLENPPDNPKITELENLLSQNDEKLAHVETQLNKDASGIKDLEERLGLVLEQSRTDDSSAKLDAINQKLSGLSNKLAALEKRIDSSQSEVQRQQEALRSEFTDHLRKLATNPPPSQVSASTDPSAVQVLKPTAPAAPVEAQVLTPPPAKTAAPAAVEKSAGPWVANLASFASERDATRIIKQLQGHGIFPKTRKVLVKGKTWYRLYIDGFANASAAKRYIDKVKSKPGLSQAWVGKAE